MSFIYTQSNLQSGMNRGIQGKEGMLADPEETMNEAVREVLTEIRIRSTRRKQPLVPNLLNGEFEYAAPSDLEGMFLIDIPPEGKRSDGEFTLVPVEQFSRTSSSGDIAIGDYNGIRTLMIRSVTNDQSTAIDPLSIAGTADWRAFGTATNVTNTTDDYVKNNTSIEFDLGATSGTTAGIYNDSIDAIDLSNFIGHPSNAYTYARITSADNITNFKLRLGTSSTSYYEFTVTTRNDGTVFTTGWNLLRFDLTSYTTTGSPGMTSLTYAAVFMTKTTGKISEAGYMFNWFEARKGKYAGVLYYSKYGWQSSSGSYKENSTDPSDLLVANTDEYDLFVKKARVIAADECDLPDNQISRLNKKYLDALANYVLKNPSEDKTVITSYYDYDEPQNTNSRQTPWTNGPLWDGVTWG